VLTVTDEVECVGFAQAVVTQEPPEQNDICIVTVDTTTGKNMILWNKLELDDVSHYNIYRESSSASEYLLVGTVEASELGLYIDEIADPTVRSWRYRISVVDDCGNESELSDHHKTMHLTMNVGLNESVNLIWDHYEGFDISTYKIYRYDAISDWSLLTSVPSNITSYTDHDPPNLDLTYYIEIDAPGSCISSLKKPGTLNTSRSNRKAKKSTPSGGGGDTTAISQITSEIGKLIIYPNPGSGQYNVNLELDNNEKVTLSVYNISGKMILNKEFDDIQGSLETKIDLSGYSDGFYNVQIRTSKTILHRILIKEN